MHWWLTVCSTTIEHLKEMFQGCRHEVKDIRLHMQLMTSGADGHPWMVQVPARLQRLLSEAVQDRA